MTKPFNKILVANRGEIACRVMQTAKAMGIATVAVYSDADRFVKHVRMADEAVRIGPAASSESYLVAENIIAACKATGAQAVHPGYGFLSENSEFSAALAKEGIAFMGPDAYAIEMMGDKIGSKKLAKEAGVSVIPGFLGEVKSEKDVLRVAHEIGYPVMVKASAGGGGKGMRVAWNDDELLEGFRLSKQEASSSFGDDRMLIEKFINNPRHIEIQVLCDGQGTSLYFPERDCSVQRRNQKVLEESPSAFLDEATRKAMGEQAVTLANAVQYKSAGTVEFICDENKQFYFLEMNTRLQVEHPITEMVSGVDLVEHMIKVAAGRKLELKQDDIKLRGHAFESRVYAEDPLRGYLPSIGRLVRYREPQAPPAELGTVRCDSGILEGSEISIYYDPLISKLVTYGENRQHALDTMAWALDNYVIDGVTNNVNLLRDLTQHPSFVAGDVTTNFLEQHYPDGYPGHQLSASGRAQLIASAAVIDFRAKLRAATVSTDGVDYARETDTDELAELETLVVTVGDGGDAEPQPTAVEVARVHAHGTETAYEVTFVESGETMLLSSESAISSPLFDVSLWTMDEHGETQDELDLTLQVVKPLDEGYRLQFNGSFFDVAVRGVREQQLSAHMPVKVADDHSGKLVCPMPGTVISFNVAVGDNVAPGAELCVVEAMKMQNVLRAETAGVVKKIHVQPGSTVAVDEILIEFEED